MARTAEYLEHLAERYEVLAPTMRAEKDRETLASVAAQYQQMADEAMQRTRRERPVEKT